MACPKLGLTLLLPKVLSSKLRKISEVSFCKIVKNKQYHMKVLLNSFHLNGHTLAFHPQTNGTTTIIDSRFDSGSEKGWDPIVAGLSVVRLLSDTLVKQSQFIYLFIYLFDLLESRLVTSRSQICNQGPSFVFLFRDFKLLTEEAIQFAYHIVSW